MLGQATLRARQRGWPVYWAAQPPQPHEWGEKCKCQKILKLGDICICPCHGIGGKVTVTE